MIKLQNVEKVYKSENGNVTALNDINLEFESSGMVFVVGRRMNIILAQPRKKNLMNTVTCMLDLCFRSTTF